MQSHINHYDNIWDAMQGEPFEKVLMLTLLREHSQDELDAIQTVSAHRLLISEAENGIANSSIKTIDELFQILHSTYPESVDSLPNQIFKRVVYHFRKVEINSNHSAIDIKLYLPIIEKVLRCFKELKQPVFDANVALVTYYRLLIYDEQTLNKNLLTESVIQFISQFCQIDYGQVIRDLADNFFRYPCTKYVEEILKNDKKIDIKNSDPKTGNTALHHLIYSWSHVLSNRPHKYISESTSESTIKSCEQLIILLIQYDRSCLSVKNAAGKIPADLTYGTAIANEKLAEIEKKVKARQAKMMSNVMLFYAANVRAEYADSPIHSIPNELARKVVDEIIEPISDYETERRLQELGTKKPGLN